MRPRHRSGQTDWGRLRERRSAAAGRRAAKSRRPPGMLPPTPAAVSVCMCVYVCVCVCQQLLRAYERVRAGGDPATSPPSVLRGPALCHRPVRHRSHGAVLLSARVHVCDSVYSKVEYSPRGPAGLLVRPSSFSEKVLGRGPFCPSHFHSQVFCDLTGVLTVVCRILSVAEFSTCESNKLWSLVVCTKVNTLCIKYKGSRTGNPRLPRLTASSNVIACDNKRTL